MNGFMTPQPYHTARGRGSSHPSGCRKQGAVHGVSCKGAGSRVRCRGITPTLELLHFAPSFNSAAVFPPCLRRRSAVSGLLNLMTKSSAVLPLKRPDSTFAFTSAPFAISSSTISLVASQSSSAESRAVEPTLLLISKSAPSFRRIFTVSVYPKKTADIRAALPSLFFRSSLAPPLWRRLPGIE